MNKLTEIKRQKEDDIVGIFLKAHISFSSRRLRKFEEHLFS